MPSFIPFLKAWVTFEYFSNLNSYSLHWISVYSFGGSMSVKGDDLGLVNLVVLHRHEWNYIPHTSCPVAFVSYPIGLRSGRSAWPVNWNRSEAWLSILTKGENNVLWDNEKKRKKRTTTTDNVSVHHPNRTMYNGTACCRWKKWNNKRGRICPSARRPGQARPRHEWRGPRACGWRL